MSSKPVLKSDRSEVRALDEIFVAFDRVNMNGIVRLLRYLCSYYGIKGSYLFPEDYRDPT